MHNYMKFLYANIKDMRYPPSFKVCVAQLFRCKIKVTCTSTASGAVFFRFHQRTSDSFPPIPAIDFVED